MSHFTVLVIGDDVEKQLQPFHEFECTGEDDEFVVDVDDTSDLLAGYESDTTTMIRTPEGELVSLYDDAGHLKAVFSKPNGDSILPGGTKMFIPDGYSMEKVPTKTIESFAECAHGYTGRPIVKALDPSDEEQKYGYILVNDHGTVLKCVDRTNPNKKWDWWLVGGRWTGFFKLKKGATGKLGKPGLMTGRAGSDRADECRKSAIDFEGMREQDRSRALKRWDLAFSAHGGRAWDSWPKCRERFPDKPVEARAFYNSQPAIVAMREFDDFKWEIEESLQLPREQYGQRAADHALVTFAVLYDGKWYERGEMGWFGIVHEEQDEDEWLKQFNKLIDSLPEDTDRKSVV